MKFGKNNPILAVCVYLLSTLLQMLNAKNLAWPAVTDIYPRNTQATTRRRTLADVVVDYAILKPTSNNLFTRLHLLASVTHFGSSIKTNFFES